MNNFGFFPVSFPSRDADTNILTSLTEKLHSSKSEHAEELSTLKERLDKTKKELNKYSHQVWSFTI